MQSYSPVNAHVAPEPSEMPGYEDQVIMAGGSFIEGATIELSADGPLREPYAAYLQGGLSYLHVKTALRGVLSNCKVD
ncbi:MAG: aluminum resistance protein [bacterium ADurb.Bin425]|nr:MAG: aluminum resistance protein [bacterium ADurb.Bin425]